MMAPGEALECTECSTISEGADVTVEDFAQCTHCGSDATSVVVLEECPAEDPDDCEDDDHHFGVGFHVREVSGL